MPDLDADLDEMPDLDNGPDVVAPPVNRLVPAGAEVRGSRPDSDETVVVDRVENAMPALQVR